MEIGKRSIKTLAREVAKGFNVESGLRMEPEYIEGLADRIYEMAFAVLARTEEETKKQFASIKALSPGALARKMGACIAERDTLQSKVLDQEVLIKNLRQVNMQRGDIIDQVSEERDDATVVAKEREEELIEARAKIKELANKVKVKALANTEHAQRLESVISERDAFAAKVMEQDVTIKELRHVAKQRADSMTKLQRIADRQQKEYTKDQDIQRKGATLWFALDHLASKTNCSVHDKRLDPGCADCRTLYVTEQILKDTAVHFKPEGVGGEVPGFLTVQLKGYMNRASSHHHLADVHLGEFRRMLVTLSKDPLPYVHGRDINGGTWLFYREELLGTFAAEVSAKDAAAPEA
jgi:hypothetical protein